MNNEKMNNKEFNNFINLKLCTNIEFQKVKEYLEDANELEEKKFYLACFTIVKQVIKKMYASKSIDYKIGKEIYTNHGLSDEEFYLYFSLYLNKIMPNNEKKKYEEFISSTIKENIWNEAKIVLWDNIGLTEIAKRYNVSLTFVKEVTLTYFKKYLNFKAGDITKYKHRYKKFRAFLELKLDNENDLDAAYEFYQTYASDTEKEEFKQTSLKILNTAKKYFNNLDSYLQSINLNIYNLYILATLFDKDFEIEIIKLFKPFYDFCNNNLWYRVIVTEEAKKQNIPYNTFREMAIIYATKILGIQDIACIISQKQSLNIRSKYPKADIIKKIYESNNAEEYFSLFKTSGVRMEDIYRFCHTYNRELPTEVKEEMEANLTLKLQNFQKENRKMPDTKIYSLEIINSLLDSPYTIEQFCTFYNYNPNGIRTAVYNTKDKDIIKKYQEKTTQESQMLKEQRENIVLNILNCIKNGFISGNTIYPFELIDFFILFPSINYMNLKTGFLPRNEAAIIRSFFLPLSNASVLSKKIIINSLITKQINYLGETYLKTFTKDELTEIVSFMEIYNIPFNSLLFHQTCIRYATGTLTIYMNESLELK